jgi:uncharacterized protein (DUF2141 family)
MNRNIFLVAAAGMALTLSTAQATITPFFSSGSTCSTPIASTTYSPGNPGPTVTVSLCASTDTEKICGATLQLQSASAAEDARFKITARTLGASMTDPNTTSITYPVSITNPRQTTDFGATVTSGTPPSPGPNQLLATFSLQPQSTATNNSYVLSLSSLSSVATEASNCFGSPTDTPISTSLTLNLASTAGSLQFAQSTVTIPEGGFIALDVTRTGGSSGAVGVNFATSGGTSVAGLDHGPSSGSLAWGNGDAATKTVVISLFNDNVATGNRTFNVTLSGASGGAALGAQASTTVTVLDVGGVPEAFVSPDISGDARADLFFRHADGTMVAWLMNGGSVTGSASLLGPGEWFIAQIADFNGDGKADLLLRNSDGTHVIWLMNGLTVTSAAVVLGPSGWSTVQAGDLNGDGKADLVLKHTDGTHVIWIMNGTTVTSSALVIGPGNWTAVQMGDFNGDAKADLMFRNTDGTHVMWIMDGTTVTSSAVLLGTGGWTALRAADFNGDGKTDLLLKHTDGTHVMWLMNGTSVTSSAALIGPGSWTAVKTGDFNGDGKADLLFKHVDGTLVGWLMDGTSVTSSAGLFGPGNWSVVGVGDFNGDGKKDLILRNTDGTHYMWQMNGLSITVGTPLLGTGVWAVVP